jgi:hypothetical protein
LAFVFASLLAFLPLLIAAVAILSTLLGGPDSAIMAEATAGEG